MWVTTIFWTLDMIASLVTGYHYNGMVELRLWKTLGMLDHVVMVHTHAQVVACFCCLKLACCAPCDYGKFSSSPSLMLSCDSAEGNINRQKRN